MSWSIQRGGKGQMLFILECVCCHFDIRKPAELGFKAILAMWPGIYGNFNGNLKCICNRCLKEAQTGEQEAGWRW